MTQTSQGFRSVGPFLYYVFRRFRLARWAIALTLLLLVLEYAGISLMIPIASSAKGGSGAGAVVRLWTEAVAWIGLPPTISTWVWLFLVMLALRSAAGYAHVLLTTYVAKQVHRQLSEDVCRRVMIDEPMAAVYKRSIGYYVSLAGDDTFRAGSLIHSALLMLAGAFSAGAGLMLLYLFSAAMFWATIGFLAVSALLVALCVRQMLRLNREAVALSRESGTNFLEGLNSLRSIRSMSCEPYVLGTYVDQMKAYTRLLFKVDGYKAGIRSVPGLVALVTGVILLGPWSAGSLQMTPEAVFAGTTIIIRVFVSLGALMTAGGTFVIDARAAKDLGELTHPAERPAARPARAAAPGGQFGNIDLVDISYGYLPGRTVLDGLNFRFEQGHAHAIIGPSGSGKSTLADLLLGIVEPDQGAILLDGKDCPMQTLRDNVVLVEQQPRMFSLSVRENLALGLETSDEQLWQALDAVDMADTVRALPGQLDTVLDYQGANLSGGQRQRLSIARALLREPRILILDEATSALDPDTRDLVVARVRRRLRDGVLVFITHDEKIASLADSVLSLHPMEELA